MKVFENADELAAVLRNLNEAALVDVIIGDRGEASFTLGAAIADEGSDAIAALLAGIEAITNAPNGA